MGERTKYAPGTFSWADVTTTDQDGAKRFYSGLFGWEPDDQPVGDGVYYSMMRLDGRNVAAISPQPKQQREAGVPPMWNNYVTVESADAAADRAAELGGTVHAPPFDVMDVGRMAALSDPTGAVVYLWEARRRIGADLVNAPGAFCWNELGTREPDVAAGFWSALLGWEFERIDAAPMDLWTIRNSGNGNGGMRRIGDETPADVPAHWLVYLAVESIDSALATAGENGGQVVVPKTQAGGQNLFAVVSDSTGANFGLFEGHLDD